MRQIEGKISFLKKLNFSSSIKQALTCPSRWLTPISGTPSEADNPLAKFKPTNKDPANPGPFVTAIASMSPNFILDS